MTAQAAEIMIMDGMCFGTHSRPLDNFLDQVSWKPEYYNWSTGNYRGYIGRWEVIGRKLYLTGIVGASWIVPPHLMGKLAPDPDPFDPQPADARTLRLADLFPDEGPLVPATWVTGVLTVLTGGRLVYVHHGFASLYASYRLVDVVQGRVRQVRDLSARDWARRAGRHLPEDWFDEEPETKDTDDEPLADWRAEESGLRSLHYEASQIEELWRPCGQKPTPRAPWPAWRDQRRRSRLWLTAGGR